MGGAFAALIETDEAYLRQVLEGMAPVRPALSRKTSEAFGQGTSDIWFRMQEDHDLWLSSLH